MEEPVPDHILAHGPERYRRDHSRTHVMPLRDLMQDNAIDEPAQADSEDHAGGQ
jgi:hypothetical protein